MSFFGEIGVFMNTTSEFRFTVDLLREYSAAALQNASELLGESTLL